VKVKVRDVLLDQKCIQRAAGISVAHIQDGAETLEVQTGTRIEEPIALGHVLHADRNAELILHQPQIH
jgi:hypothetical protein